MGYMTNWEEHFTNTLNSLRQIDIGSSLIYILHILNILWKKKSFWWNLASCSLIKTFEQLKVINIWPVLSFEEVKHTDQCSIM